MTVSAKKVVLIQGHPLPDSFCAALAQSYVSAARASGAEVREHSLSEKQYDPILHKAYREIQKLEPDLVAIQEAILWADHLVFSFPIWWGVPPAMMKGLFDRAFVPGFAYKYLTRTSLFQKKLLKGRSARLLCTMDSPPIYFRFVMGAPGLKMMKNSILKFSGVSPVRISMFGSVKLSTESRRGKWLRDAASLGKKCV